MLSLAWHGRAWHSLGQPVLASQSTAWHSSARHSMGCSLLLSLPADTARPWGDFPPHFFLLVSVLPGAFFQACGLMPGSWARGEARADLLCGDRGTGLDSSHTRTRRTLAHAAHCRVGTNTHQVLHLGGLRAFCTLCSSSGWDEMRVDLLGGSRGRYRFSLAAPWVSQVGNQTSSQSLVPKFVNESGL